MIEGLSFAKHPRDEKTGMFVRKITSADQIRELCQAYFNGLLVMAEEIKTDKDGNETRKPFVLKENKAGIAGLAAYLGINRSYLFEYMQMTDPALEPIQHVLRAARATIEAEQEQSLFHRETSRGAEFSLRCNFRWGETGAGQSAVIEEEIEEPEDDAQAIPKWSAPTPGSARLPATTGDDDPFGGHGT